MNSLEYSTQEMIEMLDTRQKSTFEALESQKEVIKRLDTMRKEMIGLMMHLNITMGYLETYNQDLLDTKKEIEDGENFETEEY